MPCACRKSPLRYCCCFREIAIARAERACNVDGGFESTRSTWISYGIVKHQVVVFKLEVDFLLCEFQPANLASVPS